jgi:outer membrane receptor protein involved in Fe transport
LRIFIDNNGRSQRAGFAAALGAAAMSIHASSFAEPSPSLADAGGLEEVVVTAQRRTESVQDVGIAISVLSGQSLAGVAYALPIQTQGQLFDVDRVEVLRGPQGTLYGRNTTGGEINFISNRPTADLHAGLTAEYGAHNEVNAEGFVSGPIADGLLGRLSVAAEHGGAWQRNRVTGQSLGDKDKVALRGQLEWDLSEALNFRLGAHFARDKSDEQGSIRSSLKSSRPMRWESNRM